MAWQKVERKVERKVWKMVGRRVCWMAAKKADWWVVSMVVQLVGRTVVKKVD